MVWLFNRLSIMLQRTILLPTIKSPSAFQFNLYQIVHVAFVVFFMCGFIHVVYNLTKPFQEMMLIDQVILPDGYFWYSVAGALLAIVLYFEVAYRKDTKSTLDKTTEILNRLVINDAVKQQRLDDLEEKVDDISDKVYLTNYKHKR